MWKKYRKKPVIIEAARWVSFDDLTNVVVPGVILDGTDDRRCEHCGQLLSRHGRIKTLEGWHIVCPGDWVVRGVKGEYYPVKPDIFVRTYDPVEEEEDG